jgi:hypothetical protein
MSRKTKGRNRNSGRRGRKHRKQETRKRTLHEQRAKEAAQEHAKRKQLAEWVEPRIARLCEHSNVGIVIPKRIELLGGRYPRRMGYFMSLCPEGLIKGSVWDVSTVHIKGFTRWLDLSSYCLETIKKEDWKPVWPKSILDRIVDATG